MEKTAVYTQVNGKWHNLKLQKSQKGDIRPTQQHINI